MDGTTTMWDTLITALNAQFTSANILSALGAVVTAGAALVVVWFGARKIVSGVQSAFKKGRIRI